MCRVFMKDSRLKYLAEPRAVNLEEHRAKQNGQQHRVSLGTSIQSRFRLRAALRGLDSPVEVDACAKAQRQGHPSRA